MMMNTLLKTRALVHLKGENSGRVIQGLITNNMNLFDTGKVGSIYAGFLNNKGRIIGDSIIYKDKLLDPSATEMANYLIECDASLQIQLMEHIKKYAFRTRVVISPVPYDGDSGLVITAIDNINVKEVIDAFKDTVLVTEDPRNPHVLPHRCLVPSNLLSRLTHEVPFQPNEDAYLRHRITLGIPEGANDLPTGACLPLESCLNWLNGVDFDKGCYIGQELTARSQFVGVTRKRLMAFKQTAGKEDILVPDQLISTTNGQPAGKIRSVYTFTNNNNSTKSTIGLAMVRLETFGNNESTSTILLKEHPDVKLETTLPSWWRN